MRVIPCLMLLLLASASAVQSQVRNAELGYSLILPEGFTDFPAARSQKDIVESWSEATSVSAGGPPGQGRRCVDRHCGGGDRHPGLAQAAPPGRVTRAARP